MAKPLVLSYSGCGTCRKALKWLAEHDVAPQVRALLEETPSRVELVKWVAASGVGVRKWLNTSGQSYRALGKAKVDAADDETVLDWLARDAKLIKRPVLVDGKRVLVGFNEERYTEHFGH